MREALARTLPAGSGRRTAASSAAAFVVLLVASQLVLPRATPNGVLLRGVVLGASEALLAAGLVLIHRSARIVNFSQAAIGGLGAFACFRLVGFLDWPFAAGFVVALGLGAVTGVLVDLLVVQRFFSVPRLVLTVGTIVMASIVGSLSGLIDRIPAVGRAARSLENAATATSGRMPTPFAEWTFDVAPFTFGFPAVLTGAVTALALGGVGLLLRATSLGTSIRAASENADRALLLGVNVRVLSTVVWTVAGVLSAAALTLHAVNEGANTLAGFRPELLVVPLAAAVIARMESIPVAAVAAVAIEMAQQAVFWSYPRSSVMDLALLGLIAGALLLRRRRVSRSEDHAASSWEVTKELRPVPREFDAVPGVRRAARALTALALLAVVVFPFASSPSQTNLGGLIFIQAIVALSLVVLTGWGGQVSLGQFALVAVGAVAGAHLTGTVGLDFFVALPVVAVLTGGFAALVGLPALRIHGTFLAVTTLVFAVAVQQTLFGSTFFERFIPDRVERPRLLFVSFVSERGYYFLCLVSLVVTAWIVTRLRRSRPGRVLIALRENEPAVQAAGVDAVRTRLVAFALAGAMCGVAGMLFVHHQRAVDPASYGADTSVAIFIMAMIGGITSVTGALLGAAYIGIAEFVIADPATRQLAGSGGLLLLLYLAPGGLASVATSIRDAGLRIVASRRQLVVPSLFEDVDAAALLARRVPLAERIPGAGLEAIPRTRRYRRDSELHEAGAR